jgi:sulfate transport system permease protein
MNQLKKKSGAWLLIALVVCYMGFLIIAPIAALIKGAFEDGFQPVLQSLSSINLWQSILLSLKIALLVVLFQAIFGTIIAWVIVRQNFFGKPVINNLLDVPFTISPVVVGYMLLLLFGRYGILSPVLERFNIKVAFAVPGMFLATLFVCVPFMIREMIPAVQNLDVNQEHAADTLGAKGWTKFWRVILPQLKNALIYGITLTFARALGEFGAVLVIGGGVQGRTETATLYIFRCLEERQFVQAYTTSILLGTLSVGIVLLAEKLKKQHLLGKVESS